MQVEKYIKSQWHSLAPLPQARSHTPTAVVDGKIYIFGGGGPQFRSMNASAVYDRQVDTWREIAPMPSARSGTLCSVVNEKAYVLGGGFKQENGQFRFLNTVEIYDVKKDSWERGPDLLMPHDYPGGILAGHYIYVLGGHHPDATKAGPKTDPGFDFCERLDIRTGTWEALPPLPTPRFALSAVAVDGKIWALGGVAFTPIGFNNFDLIEVYDSQTKQWQEANLRLPWTAAGQSNTVIDNHLITLGGYSGDGIHAKGAICNIEKGTWHFLPDMPSPRAAAGLAVIDESLFVVGGWADDGRSPMNSFFCYDP